MKKNLHALTLLSVFVGMTSTIVIAATPRVEVDSTFGTNGISRIPRAFTAALLPDGKILTLGFDSETQVLYRYTKTGSPDLSFGVDGSVRLLANGSALGSGSNILVAADGRFYLAALAADPCKVNSTCTGSVLARYLPNGQADATFGTAGFASLAIGQFPAQRIDIHLAFDPDGSIVAAENGYLPITGLYHTKIQTVIERLSSTGTSLASWSTDPRCGPGAYGVAIQDDGRIIVTMAKTTSVSVAPTDACLIRYSRNGAIDTSFGNAGIVSYGIPGRPPYSVGTSGTLLGADGKLIVGAADYDLTPADTFGSISRFLPSGQTDTSFGVPSGSGVAPANVNAIAASCGGKIVGATMGHDSFYTYIGLTRYNSNGSVDTTGSGTPDGIVSDFISFVRGVTNVLVRDDGEVIVHAFGQIGDSSTAPYLSLLIGYRQLDCQHPYDSKLQPVVEYYNASFDHYFMSSAGADTTALDSGHFVGWQRTGYTFATANTVTNPVCRFYIPPAYGDSHFFSASPVECSEVQSKFPQFILETSDAMRATVPDLVTGACTAPTTVPVYRVWDKRADTNHRYMTDLAVRDSMVAKGWVAEGYGPNAVAMCALPQ